MNEKSVSSPLRQVRALTSEQTIRVYQAYSPEIAAKAVTAQTFKPPFRRERMTWIKPSFTWMTYRCGWGMKSGQERIIGIDLLKSGFEWALAHSSVSHFDATVHASHEDWKATLRVSPVRIQWDPERTVKLEALSWRTIQIGLGGEAVDAYLDHWIVSIEDVTSLAKEVEALVSRQDIARAEALLPVEQQYPLSSEIAARIGCTMIGQDDARR